LNSFCAPFLRLPLRSADTARAAAAYWWSLRPVPAAVLVGSPDRGASAPPFPAPAREVDGQRPTTDVGGRARSGLQGQTADPAEHVQSACEMELTSISQPEVGPRAQAAQQSDTSTVHAPDLQ
jgi:hypothetical protein